MLAVFHIHNHEATKNQNAKSDNANNKVNQFMNSFAPEIIKWQARVVMGDANMVNYALEDGLAYHGLSPNLLAFHAEYVKPKDLAEKKDKNERQLKFDSCGMWSTGPIHSISMQGPARHALGAAMWPQRDDGKSSAGGYVASSYRRVTPLPIMLLSNGEVSETWPHVTENLYETCRRWRAQIAAQPGRDCDTGRYRVAPPGLVKEYVEYRASIPTLYRLKYRVKGLDGKEAPPRNIAPHLVMWHKQNRRGMLPNADRIQQIIRDYCGSWDADEADFQSIAVEIGPGDTDLVEYNREFRMGRAEFAPAASAPEVAAASRRRRAIIGRPRTSAWTARAASATAFCGDTLAMSG